MNFSHYSREPMGPLRAESQEPPPTTGKPRGLWLSVDGEDDWPDWCEAEDFDGVGPHHYRVHLTDLERVAVLGTAEAVRGFGEHYGSADRLSVFQIDWAAVASDYAGIVIAPYQWEVRLDLMWYYTWDCASGCIWDPSVIERVELVS